MNLSSLFNRVKRFGYDGAEDTGRRRQITTPEKHEDHIATEQKRKILRSNARDLARNFAIARWAINKHLDYVTQFSFQAYTGNVELDSSLEGWMVPRTSRYRFDVANRHPLRRAIRLAEACRVKDGDIGLMKIFPPSGGQKAGTVQWIESDLIRTPSERSDQQNWYNGVLCDGAGSARGYGLHVRKRSQFEFKRVVSSRNLYLHAWYDRFDQVRGISPIASALNWYRDTYEGFEYSLARMKVEQLFGLKVTRLGDGGSLGNPTATADADGDGTNDSGYKVDLGKGPFMLDMDPGDDADFMQSKTPAKETTDFLKLMIHVALKSLDIPYSFFDESFTNFYGSRGGLIQYLKSCKSKIADIQDLLRWWTDWALGIAILQGEIQLPAGMLFEDIAYEWVPDGVPWWDSAKEVRGQAMAIAAGLSSPQKACIEAGTNFEENIDEIAAAREYATGKGVELVYADSSAFKPEISIGGEDASQ